MDFILDNLFDAYGIPVGIDWKLSLVVIILGLASIFENFSNDDDYSGLESVTSIFPHIVCICLIHTTISHLKARKCKKQC